MHKFVRSLITEWRRQKLPFDNATAIVAVSGGADSVSLLLALRDLQKRKKLSLNLVVAHFNHGLRGVESRSDAEFVGGLTASLGFEFVLGKGRRWKTGNLEENARIARYKFLERTAKKHRATLVLTGHTMDDQAETVLFNLIRGSGPEGLSGMKAIRPMNKDVLLVRPLLGRAKREQTESFCRDSGVDFRHDAMNDDLSFSRVRIRKELIPLLKTYNPKIVETLVGTSTLFETTTGESPSENLKLSDINQLGQTNRFSIIRKWLVNRRGNLRSIGLKHIEAIDRLVNSRKSGRVVEVPGGGRVVKRSGSLVFERIKVD